MRHISRYDGTTWQPQSLPTGFTVGQSVSMVSAQEGWVLASSNKYSCANCVVLHYVKGQWQAQYPIPPTKSQSITLDSISMVSDTDGWGLYHIAADQHYLLRYHNGQWSSTADPTSGDYFQSERVFMRTASDGWLAGTSVKPDYPYTHLQEPIQVQFAHYDGIRWQLVNGPGITGFSQSHITALAFSAPNEAWAVGFRDMPVTKAANIHGDRLVLLHYLNGQWTVYAQ